MESRITALNRWNAAAMVARGLRAWGSAAKHLHLRVGGARCDEIGFNHFFRGKTATRLRRPALPQGHASPGIYARVFLEDA